MKYLLFACFVLALVGFRFNDNTTTTVYGTVVDEHTQPIAGATVAVKGTRQGTSTDSKGHFSITIKNDSALLVVTAIGYEQQEVAVTATQLNIVLKAAAAGLQEVVVVGYAPVADQAVGKRQQHLRGMTSAYLAEGRGRMKYEASLNGVVSNNGQRDFNREGYSPIEDNPFKKVNDNPLSTFSIDVDAASYSNVRRYINSGQLPPPGAVRIEEMINYFHYRYPQPSDATPFSIHTELASCPWNAQHQLLLIGLQGKTIPYENLPASNLVFLVDVSGSMMDEDKLPLVKASLKLLTDQLRPQDKVALVVYAGNAGLVLPSASGTQKEKIKAAINELEAGGSTAGGEGIQLAYKTARENFVPNGNNRVILCTDGDFNVGASSDDELVGLIEKERASGVFLTVLGYGTGNYQDAKMQQLADKGNGNHAYIDNLSEAKKVLIHEFGGTLFTIAKDVKLQVEFNPAHVQGYRLIGYENRLLAKEDFNNDQKDAGELGSGHTVTALYEIIPAGTAAPELDSVDKLRYQPASAARKKSGGFTDELLNVKLRYKQPGGSISQLMEHPVKNSGLVFDKASSNLRFAAAVAAFGMQLRQSKYKGNTSYDSILSIAQNALDDDKEQYRKEFVTLVQRARTLPVARE